MKKDKVMVVFGDSIPYGKGDYELGGWVNRLRLRLGKEYYVFNLGIPGQNASDILKRFETEFLSRYNQDDEFMLIFSFGIKDALLLNNDSQHLEKFVDNMSKIIQIAKMYTNNIYFMGLIYPNINIRNNYNLINVEKIDKTIQKKCSENKVNYIDLKNIITNDYLDDGLHPNEIGHEKISNILFKILGKF